MERNWAPHNQILPAIKGSTGGIQTKRRDQGRSMKKKKNSGFTKFGHAKVAKPPRERGGLKTYLKRGRKRGAKGREAPGSEMKK